MTYFWQFDICALCLACILVLDTLMHKDLKQTKNRWFLAMAVAMVISSISDIPGILMQNNPQLFDRVTSDVSTMVFLTVRNTLPWLYACYVGSLLNLQRRYKKITTVLIMIPEIIMIGWMLIMPARRLVYYYADGTTYKHGPLFNAFYVLTALYVLIGVFIVIRYRKALKLKIKAAFYCFTLLSLVPVVVQSFYPMLKWALFFQALGLLGAALTIDNEEAVRSPESGFYNKYALYHDAKQAYDIGDKAGVIFVKVPSTQNVAVAIGGNAVDKINRDMGNFILRILPPHWQMYEVSCNNYAVLAPTANDTDLYGIASQIKERFSGYWEYDGGSIDLPSVILIGSIPDKLASIEQFVYVMEEEIVPERNGSQIMRINETAKEAYEAKVEFVLRNAIKTNGLMVYYQPIYDTNQNRIHTAEALLRLFDPELGMISPEFFIPLAEKRGLMKEIGDFVFEEVCRFLSRHREGDIGLTSVDVNISAVQCVDRELPERWDKIIAKYDVKPEQICLEITESALSSSLFKMGSVIEELRKRGYLLALDDYGTGYANNAYVMQFPFDVIKIDKSILWGADKNEKSDKLLHHSVLMIHDLGMQAVVEGVETPQHREKLESAGVEFLQGYIFSKPVPESEAVLFFEKTAANV